MRAGKYPWPEGEPAAPLPRSGHPRSNVERAARDRNHTRLAGLSEAALLREATAERTAVKHSNHPLVRARRHHQAIALDVADCTVELSPGEVLALIADLEKLAVVLGWLEAR